MRLMTKQELTSIVNTRIGNETVIMGQVWHRVDASEYKVSPYGLQGDYDKNCYWVYREDVEEWLDDAK